MEKMNLKDKAKPRESFLTLLIFVLLLFTFFHNFYAPRGKKMHEIMANVTIAGEERKILQMGVDALSRKNGATLPSPSKIQSTGDNKMDILNGARKNDMALFTDFIRLVTEPRFQSGVAIDSLTYTAGEKGKGFARIPFKVTAEGALNRVTPFLEKMDSLPALVAIDSLFLGNNGETKGMDIEIGASFYQLEGGNYGAK